MSSGGTVALLFPIGSEAYALPLPQVREVVPAPRLTPLPTAPAAVAGLLNLRGDVLPVLDTGLLVGSHVAAPPAYVVVVDAAQGPVGLASGGQPRIVRLGPPAGQDGAGGPDVHTVDGEPAVLLDVRALVRLVPAEA